MRRSLAALAALALFPLADPATAKRRTPPQDTSSPANTAPANTAPVNTVPANAAPAQRSDTPAVPPAPSAPPEPSAAGPAQDGASDASRDVPRPVAAFSPVVAASLDGVSPFAPPSRSVPPSPEAPRAAKAYAVLSTYCASCHQRGATTLPAPAADFGNVLDLAALAREPTLVRPGNPDGSRLYQILYARHAPGDMMGGGRGEGPTVGEVEALRDWIEALPRTAHACPERPRVDSAELDAIMRRWLEIAGPDAARSTRFVSLAHLHNACASDAELAAYRQAVQKLLNSLSWSPEPVHIETVGDALVLLAFRLSDLNWVPAHWERLAKAEPEGGAVPMPEALKSVSGSQHPVIRGDWLASVASRAPLYYELLGLPDKQADLARLIGIDLGAPPPGHLLRAGVRQSAETGGPRLVERHGARDQHGLWLAHDWPASMRAEDVLDHPLAPQRATPGKTLPPPERTRLLLTLPNGLAAFAMYDATGTRRADDGRMAVGRACMSCHASGTRGFRDEVRPHITSDKAALPRDVTDAALSVYAQAGDLARQFEDDAYIDRRALIQAGVDPDLTLDGVEIVTALSQAYERDVGLARLVAESGLDEAEALRRLDGVAADLAVLAQRIRLAPIGRSEAERLLAGLRRLPAPIAAAKGAGAATSAKAQSPAQPQVTASLSTGSLAADTSRLAVSLWSDRAVYTAGDVMTLSVSTTRDCFLTLIDVDNAGKATVLFPNDFEQDNLLKFGEVMKLPGDKAPYQLRLRDKGRETTVAICHTARKSPLGIEADYERQRFTTLGLWRNFLNDAQPLEAAYRANPDKARAAAALRAHAEALALAKGRAAADKAAEAARAVPEPASPGPEAEARTAIQVRIE